MNRMEKLSLGVVKQGLAIQHLLLMWIFRNPGSLMARVSFTNPLFKPGKEPHYIILVCSVGI